MYTMGPYVALVYIIPVDKVKKKLGTLQMWTSVNISTTPKAATQTIDAI